MDCPIICCYKFSVHLALTLIYLKLHIFFYPDTLKFKISKYILGARRTYLDHPNTFKELPLAVYFPGPAELGVQVGSRNLSNLSLVFWSQQ